MSNNLTRQNLINSLYMQIGFSKKISQNILDDLLTTITDNIVSNKKIKISKFGTFSIREKKSRVGRNPKTKVSKIISSRNVVLFKPSKEFKNFVNLHENE